MFFSISLALRANHFSYVEGHLVSNFADKFLSVLYTERQGLIRLGDPGQPFSLRHFNVFILLYLCKQFRESTFTTVTGEAETCKGNQKRSRVTHLGQFWLHLLASQCPICKMR